MTFKSDSLVSFSNHPFRKYPLNLNCFFVFFCLTRTQWKMGKPKSRVSLLNFTRKWPTLSVIWRSSRFSLLQPNKPFTEIILKGQLTGKGLKPCGAICIYILLRVRDTSSTDLGIRQLTDFTLLHFNYYKFIQQNINR